VKKAIGEWKAEVFVVDNNSFDGTIQYLQPLFPFVQFISNKENQGFGKANNQAVRNATGQYILFLNPDTIVPENFFSKSIAFIEMYPRIGALGVQMIDGGGHFLQESKRGFPTSWASFCKLSGLTSLFPDSKLFSTYYLGHLDRESNHEVEALSGACMLVKKEVLDSSGGFDERFFMYAEDIDLSYRIQQSGYTNHYLSEVVIIHFKGESTTKDIRYVKLFYKAMVQFVKKHYPGGITGRMYTGILKMAIASRALFKVASLPFLKDAHKYLPVNSKIFLQGNKASINEIKSVLFGSNIAVTTNTADEIIFCEGEDFSFSEIIDTMKLSPGKKYKIHAKSSFSIVGSHDKRGPGNVIAL